MAGVPTGRGRSIEAIASEVGKDPSTVAYWVNKLGLVSPYAARHAAKGPIERRTLEVLVEEGLTIEQIGRRIDRRPTSVRHWLRRYGVKTIRARQPLGEGRPAVIVRRCQRHGFSAFVRSGSAGRYRCKRCRSEHVARWRRRLKQRLIDEHGGRCRLCGYDRYAGALEFHHLDPREKSFALSMDGIARSLAKAREEARKCILVCANCHAEIEGGVAIVPTRSRSEVV